VRVVLLKFKFFSLPKVRLNWLREPFSGLCGNSLSVSKFPASKTDPTSALTLTSWLTVDVRDFHHLMKFCLPEPSQGNRASLTEEPPKRGAVEAKAPVAEPPPAQILATFTVYYNTSNIQSARYDLSW
jgi:hypothetical protein